MCQGSLLFKFYVVIMTSRVLAFPLEADLMVKVNDRWEGIGVEIPGRSPFTTATDFCALRNYGLQPSRGGCVSRIATAVEHLSMHQYLGEAVGQLQAHLESKGHNLDGVEGHTASWLRKAAAMRRLGSRPEVETVLEIGFNAGHSALNWLTSNPRLRVVAFDWMHNPYTVDAAAFLYERFPGRFFLIAGPSALSLPSFAEMVPALKANIIFVDGDHSPAGVSADFAGVRHFVNHSWHRVLVDDLASSDNGVRVKKRPLPETHDWQRGLEAAWRERVATGVVEELYRVPDSHESCRTSAIELFTDSSEVGVAGPTADGELPQPTRPRFSMNLPWDALQGPSEEGGGPAEDWRAPFDESLWPPCADKPPPLHPMLGDLAVGRFLAL
mmetsp:Transcript_36241/g.71793  ORF Transcript_36241/g.71793 Transcript_36241/m.71793 type:complete len:384 (+) Transcript_36241:172-1323(+)